MRFKNLRNTAAGWAADPRVIGQGEIALVVESMPTGDVTEMRLGNGTSAFSGLTAFSTGDGGSGGSLGANLTSLDGLTLSSNQLPYATNAGTFGLTTLTTFARNLLDDADAATMRATLGVGTGSGDMVAANNLSDLASVATARSNLGAAAIANPAHSGTGTGSLVMPATWTVALLGAGNNTAAVASAAFVQQELAALLASAPAQLNTLNELAAALGNDANFSTTLTTSLAGKQPLHANLTAIAGLTSAADKISYWTGSGTASVTSLSAFARTFLDDADAATVRSTLGVVAALAPYTLTGANTLIQATHSNRSGSWSGSTTAAQALPTSQADGDYIEVTNEGSVPITFTNVTAAPGFKNSCRAGETFQAKSNGTSWRSLTPRVNNAILALTDGTTITWDTDLGGIASVTLGGNRTLAITNMQDGGVYGLWVTQDGTGSRTLAQPAAVKKGTGDDLTLSTGASKVDFLSYTYHAGKAIFLGTIKKDIG